MTGSPTENQLGETPNVAELERLVREAQLSLWRAYCDLKTRLNEAVDIAQGKCPRCGSEELHSAAIDSEAAVSCTECNYITTYKALRP